MTPRLYYLDDIPTPYRLGVQRTIAAKWPGAFKIAYCAMGEPGREWSFDFAGLDVEVLTGRQHRPKAQVNPFSFKWNPGVLRSLRAFRPDVVVLSGYVHPTMWLAMAWCWLHRVPYGVASESSRHNSVSSGAKWRLKKTILSFFVRPMAFGLPVGREAGAYLHALGARSEMFYFPNTPDTSAIIAQSREVRQAGNEARLRTRLGLPVDRRLILFVGRLIDAKRPEDAIRAFLGLGEDARDVALVFVGDGPLMDPLKAGAEGDDRVFFTGWLTDASDMGQLMAISSMMVLPSQHETWGAVVNEAMAAGIPVVASDKVGAAIELVEPGVSGFVYPMGDTDALRRAMAGLLGDPARCAAMGEAARQTALSTDHEYAADNLIRGALRAIKA